MDLAGIRFRGLCKMNHYDCTGTPLGKGDYAVVMTDRGPALGEVIQRIDNVTFASEKASFPKVVRGASADDLRAHQENARRETDAHAFCLSRIEARKLPMKLIRTEILLDRSKSIFYFTADGRIDFRELVKDLAHEMRTRIEMRQVGVRDEARMVGGIGPCGKELCCASHLSGFEPITVKMAKDQGLALNPAKLSGVCGRLMCCLVYEHRPHTRNKACGTCAADPSGKTPPAAEGAEDLSFRFGDEEGS
ncbi:MAG: regulatory iron-sulfur-containing complex subunit RicT [Deltaproteobacteria bacterium]|nr:regulatory iron-sulfur-containing complex subunit RicT [Deltaproteobacteria bacterium]MDH3382724.1 regulatory iron-sulfur-containing complex subunit RicT [Deltaproteobacteria bacterium]